MSSNLLEQHIRLHLGHDIIASVNAVQGDTGREFYFVIDDYIVPDGAEYRIYLRKPSGKEIYNYCYYANGEIVVQCTTQMLAEIGTTFGQIQIVVDHVVITSFNFRIIIVENTILSSDITSKDEFGILDELINNARITINEIKVLIEEIENAEAERVKNEENRQSAEADRSEAEQGRVDDFNDMKEEFESWKSQASTATNNATQAANKANEAADKANAAADRANEIAESLEGTVTGLIDDSKTSDTTTFSSNKISKGFWAIDSSLYTAITANANLNNYTQNGTYYAAAGVSVTNAPNGASAPFKLVVSVLEKNIIGQIAIFPSVGEVYKRYRRNNVWYSWERSAKASEIGTLSSLSTSAKSNVVSAVNEVASKAQTNSNSIGTLSSLATSNKGNLVSAINETVSDINNLSSQTSNQIGSLSNLNTANKTNIVNAINEVSAILKVSASEPNSQPIYGLWIKTIT